MFSKTPFSTLKNGVRLTHEDDIVYFTISCVMLHNIFVDHGYVDESLLPQDEDGDSEEITAETSAGKRQRDALLYYATQNS